MSPHMDGYREVEWSAESVRRFWNFYGDNAPAEQSFFARKFAARIVGMAERHGPLRGPVLDVGCGPGFLCEELLRREYRVGGVDPSKRNVARVHERLGGRAGFLGAAVAEGEALPLANARAGALFLVEVLEHVPAGSRQRLLGELRRVVRPGGLLVVTTPNDEDLDARKIACPACGCVFHRVQHVESIDAGLLESLLDEHGFEPLHVEAVNFRYFPDRPLGRVIAALAARFPALGAPARPPHLVGVARRREA
jgi:SAM-dependent methyltransferase